MNITPHAMTIPSILASYKNTEFTPQQLLLALRKKALELSDYNIWIELLSEQQLIKYCDALKNESTQSLPLYGIPFAVKDNIDLRSIPTTAGCTSFSYIADNSSFVVATLIAAGAIPLGKTNLDQFATGLVGTRSPYGECKNAFNPEYISGGSSAGSAVATALGLVSFALGTDTAGSGRVPAALNNVIGHKPTKGLLSCSGVVPACKSLDCVSIFAITAKDAAIVLDVAVKYDSADCYARKNKASNTLRYFNRPAQFRFGVPTELHFEGNEEARALYEKAIESLIKLGGKPKPINFSAFKEAAALLYEGPWVAERWLATQGVDKNTMQPEIQTIIGNGNNATAADAFAAQYKLAALKKQCDEVMSRVDFVLAPTIPTVFTRAEIKADPIKNNSILGTYTNFMNLLDYTGTAVPIGFTDSGVSWGVTLFSYAFTDYKLLAFADALQAEINLPLTTSNTPFVDAAPTQAMPLSLLQHKPRLTILVCGAHLNGQPLNWQLKEREGILEKTTYTSTHYQLYVLPDGKRPALVRDNNGAKIAVELWSLPAQYYGEFVEAIPAPLGVGKVELDNGQWVSGFICDNYALKDLTSLTNITQYGGWNAWMGKQ